MKENNYIYDKNFIFFLKNKGSKKSKKVGLNLN